MRILLDGRKIPRYGDGRNLHDWLHVADQCRGIRLVLEKGLRARSTTSVGAPN